MKLALCLYKYFPYSGLSRDFMRILVECRNRGHDVSVFVSEWQGDKPPGVSVTELPNYRWMNHSQNRSFHRQLRSRIRQKNFDAVIGFNKMPDLDIYYGADFCYIGRAVPRYGPLYRLTPRYHHFFTFERAVFSAQSRTAILSLSEREKGVYQQFYGTPDNRFHLLPPTLDSDRRPGTSDPQRVREIRQDLNVRPEEFLLLFIGSGFKTKGLDRVIRALASLPGDVRLRTRLAIVGQDNPAVFNRLSRRLSVESQIIFLGGRSDIPDILAAGDLLLHPAYSENTGTILLEALASGLPVITTDVCGYAGHIRAADAGIVLRSPFEQDALNVTLAQVLESSDLAKWRANGLRYGGNPNLYKMPQTAVDMIEDWHREQQEVRSPEPISTTGGVRMYLRDDLASALGNANSFHEVMSIGGEVFREAPGRRTLRFRIDGRSFFLKAHTGVGWGEIVKNLLYFRLPVLGAMNEWHGIHHLQRLGIDTLTIAGYGTTSGNPAKRRSFILTEELADTISLEDFCDQWRTEPPKTAAEIRFKRWLIERLALIARDIHNSGANHRDFYLCHFLLKPGRVNGELAAESSKLYVIDLHRVQLRSRTPVRWAVKDISGLCYSSMGIGLTRRDLYRFMKVYRSKPLREVLGSERLFWWRVQSRANNLYASEQRRARRNIIPKARPLAAAGPTEH